METEVIYGKVDGLELVVSFPKNASEKVRGNIDTHLPKILNDEVSRQHEATGVSIALNCDPTGERTIFYGVQYLLNGKPIGERHDIMPSYLK